MKKTTNNVFRVLAGALSLTAIMPAAYALQGSDDPQGEAYYEQIMGAAPLAPAHPEMRWQQCAPAVGADSPAYQTVVETGTAAVGLKPAPMTGTISRS